MKKSANFQVNFLPFCCCHTNFVSFLCLHFKVNGRNILSVDYDRALRIEKIYDDHRKFLLKIGYDTAGQPTLWMPSSKLLPVNLTRNSNGQLSAIHWALSQRGPSMMDKDVCFPEHFLMGRPGATLIWRRYRPVEIAFSVVCDMQ